MLSGEIVEHLAENVGRRQMSAVKELVGEFLRSRWDDGSSEQYVS